MKRTLLAALCLATLGGCGVLPRITIFQRSVPEAPLPYVARLSVDRGASDFTVRVRTRGAPIVQWRESARFQGTRYCLRNFGSSEIDWQSRGGPEDWIVASLPGGQVQVAGRCVGR